MQVAEGCGIGDGPEGEVEVLMSKGCRLFWTNESVLFVVTRFLTSSHLGNTLSFNNIDLIEQFFQQV